MKSMRMNSSGLAFMQPAGVNPRRLQFMRSMSLNFCELGLMKPAGLNPRRLGFTSPEA